MKKKELIARLEMAIERCKKLRSVLDGSDNPQVMELLVRTEAKQAAFEAVLFAMRGNDIYLNIEVG
jgi:hypothetical protein